MVKVREWYRSGRRWLIRATRRPVVGAVRLGDLARRTPISRDWGFDRGRPVDRFYIERFGATQVTHSDVLHPFEGNPRATVIADLARPEPRLEQQFDCIICTQTLQFIYAAREAVQQLHDWLTPGGVALVTVPGISQISREDMQLTGDYWRFTSAAVQRMFAGAFGEGALEIASSGNVLASIAFLHGIAAEELEEADLLDADPQFQLITTVRAVRRRPS
jgi:SAM-dependent methyltransferase